MREEEGVPSAEVFKSLQEFRIVRFKCTVRVIVMKQELLLPDPVAVPTSGSGDIFSNSVSR